MSSFTSHPMLTPHDDTVIAWQQACAQAADALRPQHDRERLAKALALAHEGAVTLGDDGAALVTSHGTRYRIDADGLCHCPDAQHRGLACKHLIALQIHRQATAALTTSTPRRHAPSHGPGGPPPQRGPLGRHGGAIQLLRATAYRRIGTDVHHARRDGCRADEPRAAPGALGAGPRRPGPGAANASSTRSASSATQQQGRPRCHRHPLRPAGEPSDRRAGADPAGGAAGPGRSGGRQQGPARCPQPGARPYPAFWCPGYKMSSTRPGSGKASSTPTASSAPRPQHGQAAEPTPTPSCPAGESPGRHAGPDPAGGAAGPAASKDQPAAPSQAPDPTPPASQDGWCARHQVAMERRSNAKGTWLSHWLADENRWCRGK